MNQTNNKENEKIVKKDNINMDNSDNIINNIQQTKETEEPEEPEENSKFWIEDPMIIFNEKQLTQLWPFENMERNEKLNAITRLIILLTLIGLIITQSITILITGIITIGIIVFLFYSTKNKENFSNIPILNNYGSNYGSNYYTYPSNKNPLMNVLLTEIENNPNRNMAAPSYNNIVNKEINECAKEMIRNNLNDKNVDKKIFNDLGDKINFQQSMRHFYATPNTTIPNNQKQFANFCYGNMKSCKQQYYNCDGYI